ncbi:hypothetical protein FTO74_08555 [Granulicella sp. WH15]|uniref:hypothetical protein n=1 Tax=Granulicella sp. WH15 TaxID=2602070 RepID=UPI00136779C9|nr:hypothetical protein [Granulicella sp. WH15]QHN03407.1 hypothetical protein FTO74_08555 [Granulicella sp. WH15]
MSLQAMTNNPFTLVKNDGRKIDFKGLLSQKTLTTFNHTLQVEDGDTVERTLPNGTLERFQVMDTGYHPGLSGAISPNYQMKVEKLGTPIPSLRASAANVTNIYNVHGPNARVNLQSVDSSSNIANIGETELFDKIRSAIEAGVLGPQREQMLSAVTELQTSAGTESYSDKFQKLFSVSANAMTVLGPFLPALGQLAASALGGS